MVLLVPVLVLCAVLRAMILVTGASVLAQERPMTEPVREYDLFKKNPAGRFYYRYRQYALVMEHEPHSSPASVRFT
jgi:hypothetical protein